jgi:cysteine desulfurase
VPNNNLIYLDNNATTRLDDRVLEAMLPYFSEYYGNASSTHHFGNIIKNDVENAREQVAYFLNANPKEIVFTAGATEGINLGMKGFAFANQHKGKHIITCQTEHKAVLDTCNYLEQIGFEVTYLPVETDGLINLANFQASLRPDTILVSIMWVNNETGVIQPIRKIIDITHQNGSYFFSDATQAVGKIPIDVNEMDIDMLCFSAHKFYGPKGVGGLFVKKNIKIDAQVHGGGHENGFRSGTSNVPGIVGLGETCEIISDEMNDYKLKIIKMRDLLESSLLNHTGSFINGNTHNRLYNVTNISFLGIDANVLIQQMKNIAVSNGSACTAAVVEPSHVLTSMGLSADNANSSIRFSLSKYNTINEIKVAISSIKHLIQQQLSSFY